VTQEFVESETTQIRLMEYDVFEREAEDPSASLTETRDMGTLTTPPI
jgi:hypothetical protein